MRKALLCVVVLSLACTPLLAGAQEKETPGSASKPAAAAHPGFERLKSLVGEWEGKTSTGAALRASYKLMSSGTVLVESLNTADGTDMITVYHPDGDRLMVTHFCASNNQPRMATRPGVPDSGPFVFDFVDVTNLENSREGVMTGVTVAIQDADHFSQTWTFRDKPGGAAQTDTFQYARKK